MIGLSVSGLYISTKRASTER